MFATIMRAGRLAQWLERCVDIAEVTGSNPVLPILGREIRMRQGI